MTTRDVEGGCDVCHGAGVTAWTAINAPAVAANHNRATGHPTWCFRTIETRHGDGAAPQDETLPLDIDDAAPGRAL